MNVQHCSTNVLPYSMNTLKHNHRLQKEGLLWNICPGNFRIPTEKSVAESILLKL